MSLDDRLGRMSPHDVRVDLDRALDGVFVKARRRRRRRSVAGAVAAAALVVLGLVGTAWLVGDDDGNSGLVTVPGGEIPGLLPSYVPSGMRLVAADVPVIDVPVESWQGIAEPWQASALYELAYRDEVRAPWAVDRFFSVEVAPDSPFDVDAAVRAHPGMVAVDVGGRPGALLVEQDTDPAPYVDLLTLVPPDLAVRVRGAGLDQSELLRVAASISPAPQAEWDAALADADVAPPYGFRGDLTVIAEGDGWSVVGGLYRRPSGPALLCVQVELGNAASDEWLLGSLWCGDDDALEGAWASADIEHVRVADDVIVWGFVSPEAALVRITYDELTIELRPGGRSGGLALRSLAGTDAQPRGILVVAGRLDVERRPSRVEVLGHDGEQIAGAAYVGDRTIPTE